MLSHFLSNCNTGSPNGELDRCPAFDRAHTHTKTYEIPNQTPVQRDQLAADPLPSTVGGLEDLLAIILDLHLLVIFELCLRRTHLVSFLCP
jgi:hypothetical protein